MAKVTPPIMRTRPARAARRASCRPPPVRAVVRVTAMDYSIHAKFRGDRHALGPFLGNLPPEILKAVVQNLGWFRTTFAMAGRTCREVVGRSERVAPRRRCSYTTSAQCR